MNQAQAPVLQDEGIRAKERVARAKAENSSGIAESGVHRNGHTSI
jgi:hypothetical protein